MEFNNITELAQVMLSVDKRLDLNLLASDEGLVVDDDLHRELLEALVNEGGVEVVLDDGGHFCIDGEYLVYVYQPTINNEQGSVAWFCTGIGY